MVGKEVLPSCNPPFPGGTGGAPGMRGNGADGGNGGDGGSGGAAWIIYSQNTGYCNFSSNNFSLVGGPGGAGGNGGPFLSIPCSSRCISYTRIFVPVRHQVILIGLLRLLQLIALLITNYPVFVAVMKFIQHFQILHILLEVHQI